MKMAALAVHHRQDVLQEIRRAAGPCARRRTTRKPSHGAVRPLNRDTPSLWFRKAADQGGVDGQYSPGQIFEMGVGVPQDNGGLCVVQIGRVPAEDDANPRRDKQQVGCFGHQYNARSNRRGSVDPRTRPRKRSAETSIRRVRRWPFACIFHATGLSICLYMAADLRDLKPLTCERRPTSEANLLFLGLRMRCGIAKDVRDERFFRVASQCSARRYLLAVREPAMGRPQ